MENKKSKEQIILDIALEAHSSAKSNWRKLYKAYFSKTSVGRMKKGIGNIVAILQDLILKPALETEDLTLLDEVLLLSKTIRKVFDNNENHITVAMNDGIITNHGVLYLCPNYNKTKILIQRRDPYTIAKYTTINGQEFVIDLVENKMWTEEKLFILDKTNNKIKSEELNFLGYIPFCFYNAHRIEFGGSEGRAFYESTYGQGEYELKAIQENLDNIAELFAFTTQMQITPPIIYSGNIQEMDIQKLSQPDSRIKTNNLDNIKPFINVTQEAFNALSYAEKRSLGHFREQTAQTDLTMGTSTRSSVSGSLVEQHKESMLTSLKNFEKAYFRMFEDLVRKVAKLLVQNSILKTNINIEELTVQKWHKDLNASESLAFLQNFAGILGMLPEGVSKIETMDAILTPVVQKYVSRNTDEPEKAIQHFKNAMAQAKLEAKQIEVLKQQQLQQAQPPPTQEENKK